MTKLILSLILAVLLLSPVSTLAANTGEGPYLGLEYAAETGLSDKDVRSTAADIINAALGLLGIIFVVIMVYAGFKWMTSQGNEETTKGAQKMIFAAIIGLIIILSAYIITKFVTTQIFEATTDRPYSNVGDNT